MGSIRDKAEGREPREGPRLGMATGIPKLPNQRTGKYTLTLETRKNNMQMKNMIYLQTKTFYTPAIK